MNKLCLHCGKQFNEPLGPTLFFCSDSCASKHNPTLRKNIKRQLVKMSKEAKRWEDLPFETAPTWKDIDNIKRQSAIEITMRDYDPKPNYHNRGYLV